MLVFTTLIGGFNYTISKIVMPAYIQPSGIIVLRGIVCILVFGAIDIFFVKERVEKKDFGRLLLCALFGIAINQLMFYNGLNLTTPINASLMMTTSPIIILVISSLVLKERITFLKVAGLILGATGTILLLLHSGMGEKGDLLIGDIMVLINAISWGCFLVTVKPLMMKYNPFTVLKWVFFFGFFMVLPFGYHDFISVKWELMTYEAMWALAFVVIFATLFAYYYNAAVLKYVNTSIAGSYIYLQPVLAAAIAIAWGKDIFSLQKLAYSFLILSGVYLVSLRKNNSQSNIKG